MLGGTMENFVFARVAAAYAFFFVVLGVLVVFLKVKLDPASHIDGIPVNRHPLFLFVVGIIAFIATLVQVWVAMRVHEPQFVTSAILSAIACLLIWLKTVKRSVT
jgi:hypothetical protein